MEGNYITKGEVDEKVKNIEGVRLGVMLGIRNQE